MSTPQSPGVSTEQNEPITAANVDLSNCDRELIQYSGAVQPHGALVALIEPDLTILQVSANTDELFGMGAAGLLGRNLAELLGTAQTEQVRQRLLREALVNAPAVHVVRAVIRDRPFHVVAHRTDGVLILELEIAGAELPVMDLYSEVRSTIGRLQNTTSLQDFFDLAVKEIRHLTGYDRVMAYRFLPDGSGEVTSEAVAGGLEAYLGLHYPASDIPQPARRMFSLAWLRHLPDVGYTPVSLTPAAAPSELKMTDPNRPILLIEDSNEDFEVTSMAIRQAGVANPLLRCRSGREARDYIGQRGHFMHAVEPLFILVDLNIPGVDGRKVLAEIRKSPWLSAIPVIVLSTSTNPGDVRLCYQLGAAGYLVKPVEFERFQSMIGTVAEYWMNVVRLSEQEELGYAR